MPYNKKQGKPKIKKRNKSFQNPRSGQHVEQFSQLHLSTQDPEMPSAIEVFNSLTSSEENLPYVDVSISFYHDYINKRTEAADKNPWLQIAVDPFSLPMFLDKDKTAYGDLSIIFKSLDIYCMPKWFAGENNNTKSDSTYMFLGGVPARPSGVPERDDDTNYDDALYQPHRRLLCPDVRMQFRHTAHCDYLQLQKNQQQLIRSAKPKTNAVVLYSYCCVEPDQGGSMQSKTDINIKIKTVLKYSAPIALKGKITMQYNYCADPTEEPNTGDFVSQLVFPKICGIEIKK